MMTEYRINKPLTKDGDAKLIIEKIGQLHLLTKEDYEKDAKILVELFGSWAPSPTMDKFLELWVERFIRSISKETIEKLFMAIGDRFEVTETS